MRFCHFGSIECQQPSSGIDTIDPPYYTLQMAMGKRKRARQPSMWITTTDFPTAASHPFYTRLNQPLRVHRFDDFPEGQWAPFYADLMGRQVCRQAFISGCC